MDVVKLDDSLNVENPLPNHNEVNMMSGNIGRNVKTNLVDVRTPLRMVWKEMKKRGLIAVDSEKSYKQKGNYCEFDHETGHEIQECTEFKTVVQGMMDNKEVEFYEEVQEERNICTSELTAGVPKTNYPVVIISRPKYNEARVQVPPKVIIQRPATFSFKDSKKVPWKYECSTTIPGKEILTSTAENDQDIGFHTRSEKRYDLINPHIEPTMEEALAEKQKRGKAIEPELSINEPIKEEAKEFLKFLKHSEYSVVEQLHKQPARISVLALLLSSEVHRKALMKGADNFIFFNDVEIPSGGRGSTKALLVTTRCKGYILPGVLVDNGSALNVLPLSTLSRLPVDSSHMKACQSIVKAFDGTKKSVMERMEVPLKIDPITHEVDFLKVKLVSEGRLITINAEEDIIATVTGDAPYVEIDEEATDYSFRSLEFVNAMFVAEGSRISVPKISKTMKMGLQLMVGMGALPRRGLERYLQGRIETPVLKDKFDRFGLGYRPDMKQKKEIEKRQERRRARLSRKEGGFIHPKRGVPRSEDIEEMLENVHINAIETIEKRALEICPCEPGSELNNWTVEEISVVFRAYSESSDINDMSDATSNTEPLFEEDMCLEGSHDFGNDEDCCVSPDLLRMVEQEDKHILPYKESLEILRLNLVKCTFGARSEKLLGFIVSRKGIEVDPDKVKAIRDLPPPRTQKEVQGFLGRLNYIARFISQLTEKCDPVFCLLKKHNSGE
ncbi:uncharacterized protein LOC128034014 [Gossypium raimondii]|uniref:uncharacterized protein LOC128034014 n=1 Tax=Gossypium raimondii TaxID=29730 RepID=UPI00227B38AB|nr:uncharacterized protein LOC128034014 [Gossypium raimondii]